MMTCRGIVLGLIAMATVIAAPRGARAECDAAEAERRSLAIRQHLDAQASYAKWWDVGWGVGLGVAAAGQVGLLAAEWSPGRDYTDDVRAGLIVGAGQSVIGSVAHIILPLEIVRPGAPSGDACRDADDAERALRATAAHEKGAFYLNHVGNVVVAGGGLLILGLGFDTWQEGATGAVLSYAVGLATTYTQPRGSWKAVRHGSFEREPSVTGLRLTPVGGPRFSGLMLTGAF